MTNSGKNIGHSVTVCSKTIVHDMFLVFKDNIVHNISDVVLKIDNFTVRCKCQTIVSTFFFYSN